MEVKQATAQDVTIIATLFDQYRVFYEQESDLTLAEEFLTARLANQESVIFFAIDEKGSPLGFTQLYPTFSSVSAKRSWILNDLFVTEQARGQGVARALMNAAKQHAIDTQAKGLALETAHTNHTAQKLYESLGYQRDNEYYSYFLSI
ncbi:GNAT family N-acetyltransferase [Vibrio mexicanus]|uniref:GNAT family N-acetyltransferase n=1 Tax=Vibrio mexicanus TaxID=1004326 RepID=UPI00063CF529|nr:GNAT family N-acetyltransferase [Vibrio mexicanus]